VLILHTQLPQRVAPLQLAVLPQLVEHQLMASTLMPHPVVGAEPATGATTVKDSATEDVPPPPPMVATADMFLKFQLVLVTTLTHTAETPRTYKTGTPVLELTCRRASETPCPATILIS